jgi:hypothetical protein
MKLVFRVLAVVLIALGAAGCATQGTPYKQAETTLTPPAAGNGRIWMYRDSALGFAIQPNVTLNGAVVGTAVPNAAFYLDRPKGSYEVAASTEVEKKASFTLEGGEVKYIRLTPTFGVLVGRIVPELVSADEAKKALADLNVITASSK